jgi:hypothetical protein
MVITIIDLNRFLAESPPSILERTLMAEYLLAKGYLMSDLTTLPPQVATDLMAEARRFSAIRLVEIAGGGECQWKMRLPISLN